jgi:hypothetical protein
MTGEPRSGKGEIAKSGKYLMMRHFWGQKELLHSRFVVFTEVRGCSFPDPLCQKGCFLAAVVLEPLWAASGIFENQGATISERDFGWPPNEALVILLGIIYCRCPFLVEPVEVRFIIGDPFLDGLPGWLDGLHDLIRPPRPAGFGFASVQNASVPRRFSMSKGGGGGRGRWIMPSQRPWRRTSICLSIYSFP